jgi:hypothetical protein
MLDIVVVKKRMGVRKEMNEDEIYGMRRTYLWMFTVAPTQDMTRQMN